MAKWVKISGRTKRHKIIRKTISGVNDKPRLSVRRSLKYLYVQLVDDTKGQTLLALSTYSPEIREKIKKDGGNVKGAVILGAELAERCKQKGITKVVFDRAGYMYHGRVKALADAARKGGLQF